ncbi:MAG: hypothetical protein IJB67_01535 [Firmicutes bacterium]|nr:hypothetical protein [Bacillota bacterium]
MRTELKRDNGCEKFVLILGVVLLALGAVLGLYIHSWLEVPVWLLIMVGWAVGGVALWLSWLNYRRCVWLEEALRREIARTNELENRLGKYAAAKN